MKKLLLVIASAFLLGGCTPKDLFFQAPAGLDITTVPTATVMLNGVSKGSTPYSDKTLKPGSYTIKLVPSDPSLAPYETSFTLTSHASTVISRNFAASDLDATGYTLELQQEPSGATFLSIISDPNTINVTIDGKPSGFTPLSKLTTTPGSHSLVVTSPGYLEQDLSVNTVKGYNLIVNFKLASQTITLTPAVPATGSGAILSSPSPSPTTAPAASKSATLQTTTTVDKPYVLIGDTGTGWLRVHKDASGTSDELGKANTGEKLPYLGESTDIGWVKVEFEGSEGWVSGKYTTLVK